jgi:hypothetical protein
MNAALTLVIAAFTGIMAAASFKQAYLLSLVQNPDMNHTLWTVEELFIFGFLFTTATTLLVGLAIGLFVTSRK